MRLELHCHSTRSDGSEPPHAVARRALDYGVELFCLTDHDTVAGFEDTRSALPTRVRVLRGLELSTVECGRTVHLLCYGIADEAAVTLEEQLEQIRRQRSQRLRAIVKRLGELGMPLDADEILTEVGPGGSAGRPHVAQALQRAGHVSSVREAFDRFLADGKPAYVAGQRLSVADGLALARGAGAQVALAHPHTLGDSAIVRALFADHRDAGLTGIEAFYGRYGSAASAPWLRVAAQFDLTVTGGSDFHGSALPEVVRPGITFPAEHTERLLGWLDAAA
ncbi:MAG: PHP domain-containing protein [Myxococcales bacterium FL481]|nr:MAG: PHP domain-containing protein [Myxococcales bacterium FL481]